MTLYCDDELDDSGACPAHDLDLVGRDTMITLTRIVDKRGDFVIHVGGCADIKRAHRARSYDDRPQTYGGATLAEAIREADGDMAAWFGQEPYQVDPPENPWTVRGIDWAPCFVSAVKAAGVTLDPETGEPGYMAERVAAAEDRSQN